MLLMYILRRALFCDKHTQQTDTHARVIHHSHHAVLPEKQRMYKEKHTGIDCRTLDLSSYVVSD